MGAIILHRLDRRTALLSAAVLLLGADACPAQVADNLPTIANAREQFFQSDGVRIRYLVAGRGEPVILVHGWSASAERWAALMNDLSKDHQVIAMDCRGHGRSDKPHAPSQYGAKMSDDVVRLMDHLGLKRAHVVGYSMGGMIAMKVLVDHPGRLLSVVSGAGAGYRDADDPWDAGLIRSLETGMPLSDAMIANRPAGMPEPDPQQREIMRRMDASQDPIALAAQRRGNVGLRVTDDELRQNRVPTLVIYGSRDAPERFEPVKKVFAHAEFVEVEGAGHASVPDTPAFVGDVRDFLARHAHGRP
jgi:pimeloyl-ACP methyl ester carboxylesterase